MLWDIQFLVPFPPPDREYFRNPNQWINEIREILTTSLEETSEMVDVPDDNNTVHRIITDVSYEDTVGSMTPNEIKSLNTAKISKVTFQNKCNDESVDYDNATIGKLSLVVDDVNSRNSGGVDPLKSPFGGDLFSPSESRLRIPELSVSDTDKNIKDSKPYFAANDRHSNSTLAPKDTESYFVLMDSIAIEVK